MLAFACFFCCCDIDAFLHGMFDPKDHKINLHELVCVFGV